MHYLKWKICIHKQLNFLLLSAENFLPSFAFEMLGFKCKLIRGYPKRISTKRPHGVHTKAFH